VAAPVSALRVAIAGATGFIGPVHARAARRAGGHLVGVAASTPERAREAADSLGAEHAFASPEELAVADGVDVVHICTPNHLHAPLAAAALAAGKHVICEKPLATSAAEADALLADAQRSGRVATVPFVYRYNPVVAEARVRVAAGDLGGLRLVHGGYLQDWLASCDDDNWRVDPALSGASRAFADIGSHWCDLMEFVCGDRIAAVCAQTATVVAERADRHGAPAFAATGEGTQQRRAVTTEDLATVMFRTAGGVVGTMVVSQVSPGRKNHLHLEIAGERASLRFEQERPETLWIGGRERTEIVWRDPVTLSAAAARLATTPAGHPQGYEDCFAAFIADTYAAIEGRSVDGLPTFADGARSAHIVDAVLASARAGAAWVDVAPAVPRPAAGCAGGRSCVAGPGLGRRGHARAGGERSAAAAVEQVDVVRLDAQLCRGAGDDAAGRIQARDRDAVRRQDGRFVPEAGPQLVEVLALGRRTGVGEVGVDVGAHRLRQLDRCGEHEAVLGGVGEVDVLEVLGPDADDHPPVGGVGALDAAAQLVGERQLADRGAHARAGQLAVEEVHGRRPDEPRDEQVDRVRVQLARRVDLLQEAGAHDRDAVAERHRLDLVVGHVHRRRAEALLQARNLRAHLHAQLRIEVRQRLVHQEHGGLADDRPAHRDALALAAGKLGGPAVEVLLEVEDPRRVQDAALALLGPDVPQLEPEAHVLAHGHLRVQRVVLEDHRDVAVLGGTVVDDLAADPQRALGDVLESCGHPQGRRLPAAGRAHEDHELAVGDLQVHASDGLEAVGIPLDHPIELDIGHGGVPFWGWEHGRS
jgi:predicted dehydrogenase